jgi:hypothetical protein
MAVMSTSVCELAQQAEVRKYTTCREYTKAWCAEWLVRFALYGEHQAAMKTGRRDIAALTDGIPDADLALLKSRNFAGTCLEMETIEKLAEACGFDDAQKFVCATLEMLPASYEELSDKDQALKSEISERDMRIRELLDQLDRETSEVTSES